MFNCFKTKRHKKHMNMFKTYVEMMCSAIKNNDENMAYKALKIGNKAAKKLGFDDLSSARDFYFKEKIKEIDDDYEKGENDNG